MTNSTKKLAKRLGYIDLDMEQNHETPDENSKSRKSAKSWWENLCLRCHQADSTPSWQPPWWSKIFPFPFFSTYRQTAQQICIIMFFLLTWGILYAELGESIGLNGELLSMSLLVISAYLIGWIWLKITTLPALIGMLVTGIAFQNLHLVHMTDSYRKLNQDLRKIALVIILTRAGLGLDAAVLKKHYAAVLQLGLLPWLVECVAISVSTHYLLNLPWIWGFLLGSMIASVSPAVVVPCLFRLRDVGYGVSKGIPTIVVAAAAVDDSISVAIFAIILNALFSTGSATFNIIKGPLSIIAGVALGSLWGAMTSIIPEKGDTYVVPLRFLALFLGGLFSYFISSMIGWSGAGPLAIVSSGFVAAYFWEKQGWPINRNPVSNIFRILWIFFEPILFAFTGAQVTISALDPQVIKMATICLVSCLVIRGVATYFVSFGCGLNSKEKIFIGLTWTAKATVQAALGPAALDLVNNGQTSGAAKAEEEYYAKTILAVSVLSVMISAPLGALLIALAGPRLLTKDDIRPDEELPEPSLHIMAKSTVYNVGEIKGIFCKGQNLVEPIHWYSPSGKLIEERSTKNNRVFVERKIEDNGILVPLIIHKIKISDGGNWTCKAGNLSETREIIVGEKVKLTDTNVTLEGEEGKSVKLTCEATGYPAPVVVWYKDKQQIREKDEPKKYSIKPDNTLEIKKLNHADVGLYVCKVRQKALSHYTEKNVHLSVQHKPILYNSDTQMIYTNQKYKTEEVYAILNDIKNVTCSAIANPPPTYEWFRRQTGSFDTPITDSDTVVTSEDKTNSVLILRIRDESYYGEYKCSVTNNKGVESIIFHVNPGSKPEPPDSVSLAAANTTALTFNVTCASCIFSTGDEISPDPKNLTVIGYTIQLATAKAGYPVDWDGAPEYRLDVEEANNTLFTIGHLTNGTVYHVRVRTRNAAGNSEWMEVPDAKTTDDAIRLTATLVLVFVAIIVHLY